MFSLREQTGQMLVAGFEGTSLNPQIEDLVVKRNIGGLILFERNFESPAQLTRLNNDLQKLALTNSPGVPLFISVDQEGGRVSRLKAPFTLFPPQCCLGMAKSESLSHRFGRALGLELKAAGINLVYAPVLDVNTNPENPIIGERALSNQTEWAARLGVAVIRGIQEGGILPVGKHFPGHGDTFLDSHLALPNVDRNAPLLEKVELPPFAEAVKNGLEIIMTAHVNYPAWDPKNPATFSRPILQGILREKLGFKGLIISDDLEMKAVEDNIPFQTYSPLGINAGLDLFLICHSPEKIKTLQDQMIRNVENGKVPESRIVSSFEKILTIKKTISKAEACEEKFFSLLESHRELAGEMASYLSP